MMKQNLTEIVFILDRSGSMSDLTNDTIGGFNSFISEQKKVAGEAVLTTVLFNDKYEILHNGIDIKKVAPLTDKEYSARGSTALLDAIGKTINSVGERLASTKEDDRPEKVVFVITTDGEENASVVFSQSQVKAMIEHQTEKYSWQFLFLGANIDAVSTAQSYGINADFASNHTASAVGIASVFGALSVAIKHHRGSRDKVIGAGWSAKIK
jgi:uncharacterized protein YegL